MIDFFKFSDQVYSFGGQKRINSHKDEIKKEVYVHSSKRKWSQLQNMKTARGGHQSLVFGNKIVHIGGTSVGFYHFV